MAIGRLGGIKDRGDMRWLAFLYYGEHGIGEGENRRGVHAF